MTQRIQRHPYLAIFDGADPSTSTATRMVTTTPLQSLYLLNNEFVHQQADRVAQRALGAVPENPQEFIGFIERCLLVTRRTMKWIRVSHILTRQIRSWGLPQRIPFKSSRHGSRMSACYFA